jgi:hypothetical protein
MPSVLRGAVALVHEEDAMAECSRPHGVAPDDAVVRVADVEGVLVGREGEPFGWADPSRTTRWSDPSGSMR